MSRSLKLSTPGLCLIAALSLACIGGRTECSVAQEHAADPAATPAESGPDAARSAQRGTPHTFDLSPRSLAARKIESALEDPVGVDIEFVDQPLKEAMEFLADAHGIPILLDEKALQDEGIQTDEPLNYHLSDVTLRSALNIMLEPLGLTHVIDDEVLKITTGGVAEELLETRVYDVRPLVRAGISMDQLSQAILETIQPGTWARPKPAGQIERDKPHAAYGGRSGLPFDPAKLLDDSAPAEGERPSATERYVSGLVALEGALVVTQDQNVHRHIVALLDQLGRFAERTAHDRPIEHR